MLRDEQAKTGEELHIYSKRFCRTCDVVKQPLASHCGQCNHCVKEFDHHCGMTNNCIGIRTKFHFVFFSNLMYWMSCLYLFELFEYSLCVVD
mmetsp:Transcript_17140/g.12247  ORF Transcript_17140/g.12247 Transcript_17140/m.12247 type:complete len:92 (+) Transcript_17140:367-642(+)